MSHLHQNTIETAGLEAQLAKRTEWLRRWLLDHAFDLWWKQGADERGGFYERLDQAGKPVLNDNRRARVQPRQAYCYTVAGKMGWQGPWKTAVQHGLDWFEKAYRREDGLFGALVNARGEMIDDKFDLYNHSFALFGYASAAAVIPERAQEYHERALSILHQLNAYYKHPIAGFEEKTPPGEPLCSNPHMHMFEAALTWEAVASSDLEWHDLADELANLAMNRLIDADTGVLREFFGREWYPLSNSNGTVLEPGHQFEWAWLLTIWAERRQRPEAIRKAMRLFDLGEHNGICKNRHVAVMSLYDDLTVHDGLARLWSQTEWLKAALRLKQHSTGNLQQRYLKSAIRAADAVLAFIPNLSSGLWGDKWIVNSVISDEPAPASTFYHIVAAVTELTQRPPAEGALLP